ncbi:polyprenyl synthetase family protein [Mailhella sp.]|uniref:polyprenyl synthetase family protein n=1 Tax=Mailhella sp. TaxID=1981029 RepID=UPI004064453A
MPAELRTQVETFLSAAFLDSEIPPRLAEAMRYSLLAGGKRLRPVLLLASARACAPERADELTRSLLPFAAGLEMIHTYSLIHDDLPTMDDDDLRRGKPTCHKAYDEATAILAGDALLTNAFGFMARADAPAPFLLEAVRLTADAAGAAGMVGGQVLDLAGEGRRLSLEELRVLNAKKTGALIYNACECGAVLAGASAEKRAAMRAYGAELGIAFQITDDILDVIGDEATVGKEVRHDAESEKATWPSLLGLEASIDRARGHCAAAEAALEGLFSGPDADFLRETARKLVNRTH